MVLNICFSVVSPFFIDSYNVLYLLLIFKIQFQYPIMKKNAYNLVFKLLLISLLQFGTYSQQQEKTPSPPTEKEDDTLRIETNLVQVEAIIKDNKGNVVTDLQKSDFEIVEDGSIHSPDFASFVSTNKNESNSSNQSLTLGNLRRTFVFILNNPIIDFGSFRPDINGSGSVSVSGRIRTAQATETTARFLNKFVDEQMGGQDMVALVDTEANLGIFSNFTNDRDFLRAGIKQMQNNLKEYRSAKITDTNAGSDISQVVAQNLAALETTQSAIAQLGKLPGRKIIVLISRGLLYNTDLAEAEVVKKKVQTLILEANQAAVTIYFLSPTGLGLQPNGAALKLAQETGGRAIYNTNDVGIGFAEVLKENDGYYLLAYDPGEGFIQKGRQVSVRVKRPDLKAQTRSMVYQNGNIIKNFTNDAKSSGLMRILRSPLVAEELKLSLSSMFIPQNKEHKGFIKSLLKIDSSSLNSEIQSDGSRLVKFYQAIRIIGPDNRLIKENAKKFSLKLSPETWEKVISEGLIYQFDAEVKQSGYYQISSAVCLNDSERCGKTNIFLNVDKTKSQEK